RLCHLRRADGRRRRADADVLELHRAGVDLQPELHHLRTGQRHRRRHVALGRADPRRAAAFDLAANSDCHHCGRSERADHRRAARAVRGARARGHPRPLQAMADAFLKISGVSKHFGGFTALADVSLDIARGERFGLIGPNGSGKTTLINCVSGLLRNDAGSIVFNEEEVSRLAAYQRTRRGIARSFQVPRPFHSMTVLENLLVPSAYIVHLKDADGEARAMEILASIGLADKAAAHASQLSQVELRKLELARAMAAQPKLLISDEAMAGLAGNEVDEVLAILFKLNESGITIIMIEHIMQAVMRFSQRVVCLDAGKIICEGTPASIVQNPDVQKAYLGA